MPLTKTRGKRGPTKLSKGSETRERKRGVTNLALNDADDKFGNGSAVKRRLQPRQLVEGAAQRPHVGGATKRLVFAKLRRHIPRCSSPGPPQTYPTPSPQPGRVSAKTAIAR